MTQPICGDIMLSGGRRMICRRSKGHEGEHSYTTATVRRKHPLELVALASDLLMPLPEGDYTDQVKRVYINRRTVMIEFSAGSVEELVRGRKRG